MSNELYEERFFIPLWSETHVPQPTLLEIELANTALTDNIVLGEE